ncbi:MAG TPA: hypothetical protein VF671_05220 [Pseudomonas sp.]|jgi:hypothetical protein|uniref:hypothetical protein n=1 Tax=Pseudomonas sp. TaxID=306 RepID=UPI002ED92283
MRLVLTFKLSILTFAALAATGCASIVSESRYPVSVTSAPSGAAYEITNEGGSIVSSGVTPNQVVLKAGAGYFDGEKYTVNYRKEGYLSKTEMLDTGMNGWYWGNIVFGGLIGMLIVDPLTGAMYRLPEGINSNLSPIAVASQSPKSAPPITSATE